MVCTFLSNSFSRCRVDHATWWIEICLCVLASHWLASGYYADEIAQVSVSGFKGMWNWGYEEGVS